jgi:hypothetical protein
LIEENQKEQLKYLIVVQYVEELDDIYQNMIFVEFVLEKKLMLENYQVLENLVGKNS